MTEPDIGLVTLGVRLHADVRTAQEQNAMTMDEIITSSCCRNTHARTSRQSCNIYPVYDDETRPFGEDVKYYQVTSMVR